MAISQAPNSGALKERYHQGAKAARLTSARYPGWLKRCVARSQIILVGHDRASKGVEDRDSGRSLSAPPWARESHTEVLKNESWPLWGSS